MVTNTPSTTAGSVTSDPGFRATAAGFLLGLATILGAWGSQLIFGLVPCELCLEQRLAYYWGLPVLALVLLMWTRLPRTVWMIGLGLGIAIFLWSTWMGGYHAGVEWGFWPGPTACTGTGTEVAFEDLMNMDNVRVIPCDMVQFRFLGISLAGYNALISIVIVALLGWALAKGRRT
ncbi:disulfide bond formation protein B [Devosia sp.]|uniref:disulfide bond formation protein B n=1 Tax=Devosia sp. TaxID=1871048 RepID=UPI003A9231EC